jgi:hypothetical protein
MLFRFPGPFGFVYLILKAVMVYLLRIRSVVCSYLCLRIHTLHYYISMHGHTRTARYSVLVVLQCSYLMQCVLCVNPSTEAYYTFA